MIQTNTNELSILNGSDIKYQKAPVTFDTYGLYMAKAQEVANYVKSLEPTEDSVKEAKDVLASARKLTKALNDRRIAIERDILSDFMPVKGQISNIIAVIDEADTELRGKVRELEEAERTQKELELMRIWSKREWQYKVCQYDSEAFSAWLTPQHLNKTMSIAKCEKDMVEWLEKREKDLEVLEHYDTEYTAEYLNCYDLQRTIHTVQMREEQREKVYAKIDDAVCKFTVTGKANINLVKRLMIENEIEFECEDY